MFWGGGRSNRNDNNNSGPLGIILVVFGLLLLVLAPIIAALMQMAISRRREYQADASGVLLTRYPPGLISALEKLRSDKTVIHTASKATAHLWIESPLDEETPGTSSKFNHLFDTHPPLEDRIRILKAM
jgi:heat shock protein HtpX